MNDRETRRMIIAALLALAIGLYFAGQPEHGPETPSPTPTPTEPLSLGA